MTFSLTSEQILALAPDASSAKAGRGLAVPRKWRSLGGSDQAVWGECQGSGSVPYQVQVDLSSGSLAYRCSCPSRKLPCKHTLGLLLLRADQAALFSETTPPDWMAAWLEKRAQTAQKRAARPPETGRTPDPDARARRAAARDARIQAGLTELDQWLADLVRQGLSTLRERSVTFWQEPAARMVDAQAPGVARLLRNLATISASGTGWQERLLEQLGLIHLLIAGYRRLDTLPPATQADIRTAVGLPVREEDVLPLPELHDHWLVVGQVVDEEDNLRVQRTWLWGQASRRPALLLSFAVFNQPLDCSLLPGTGLDASLVFYPGAVPLRALVKVRQTAPRAISGLSGTPDVHAALGHYAAALAANPWLERFPLLLQDMVLVRNESGWLVRDAAGHALPLSPRFSAGWRLLGLTGGHPWSLFGEWDGRALLPLGAWVGDQFRVLGIEG